MTRMQSFCQTDSSGGPVLPLVRRLEYPPRSQICAAPDCVILSMHAFSRRILLAITCRREIGNESVPKIIYNKQ